MTKKEIGIIVTPEKAKELEGFTAFVSIVKSSLVIRIPFIQPADITTLRIYNILIEKE